MTDELNYNPRPREMRDRDASERWTPAANRRPTARRDSAARGPNYKLIRRGLNRDTSGPHLSRAIGMACANLDRESLDAMRRLIYALDAVACPLVTSDGGPRVLARLSRFHDNWIRSPRTWRQLVSDDTVQIVTSIASHLLGKYAVPRHLNDAWMHDTELHQAAREWYVRLAGGQSLRGAGGFPFTMTRAMLHHFVDGLNRYELRPALRYAQFRGIGVNDEISSIVALSELGNVQRREAVALEVARFLARSPTIEPADVRPIIDFALAQRVRFTFDGRTPASVQRLVELWHQRLYTASLSPRDVNRTWKSCGIAGHEQTTVSSGVSHEWQIVELLSTIELRDEGATMRHCVASYTSRAASGSCAIFSLRRRRVGEGEFVSQVTIEVDPKDRQIVQARRKRNEMPSADEMRMIRDWSRMAQLELRERGFL